MWDTNGAKYKRMIYNLNWAKKKSGKKYKKAIDRYLLILKKESQGRDPKWVAKTKVKCLLRLKKYWISSAKIKEVLESRGLNDLIQFVG